MLAKGFARGPSEYAEAARQLGQAGVLTPAQAERPVRMARCRNRLVHGCDQVTAPELYELLARRRQDIDATVGAITDWMAAHPERVADSPAHPARVAASERSRRCPPGRRRQKNQVSET